KKDFTVDTLIAAAYDSYLTWFEKPISALIRAWEGVPADQTLKGKITELIQTLRAWDLRWGVNSVATSLAVVWGEDMQRRFASESKKAGVYLSDYICNEAPKEALLQSLSNASEKLTADFGKWRTPWGDINRFQRLNGDIVQPFSDAGPSTPVGFTSAV